MADPYSLVLGEDYDILGDILGDDDVGDDALLLGNDYDILGAARRSKKNRGNAALARAATKGAIVRERQKTQVRRLPLPLDTGAVLVAAGATAVITVQPNVTTRPEKFSVAPESAPHFTIDSISIGRKLQLGSGGSIAASLYDARNPDNGVQWDTADRREPIEFRVTNQSAAPARFMGLLIGTTVE